MSRHAVEWYCPKTAIGDGGPYRGTRFVDAPTPTAAWDAVEAEFAGTGRVIVRSANVNDLADLRRDPARNYR